MNPIKPYIYSHSINGVQVKPLSDDGKKVSVLYNGTLSDAGADQIYLHFGFGNKNNWSKIEDQPMERQNEGWEKTVHLKENNQLNFCFRDNFNNWDNNNGANWIYRISEQ